MQFITHLRQKQTPAELDVVTSTRLHATYDECRAVYTRRCKHKSPQSVCWCWPHHSRMDCAWPLPTVWLVGKSSESVQCAMLKACDACADMGQL